MAAGSRWVLLESGLDNQGMLCGDSDGGYRPLPGTEAGVIHSPAPLSRGQARPHRQLGFISNSTFLTTRKGMLFP